ncbi:Quercetin 2,3-dioxygenase [Rosistilla carotiformis]|uniref:Quercetin 2,3-dioxygenase n=1 Tax=Rosistilla carotiformis TaxID=2528017 RepID=A0A518JTV4_9BACT|nr:pirin family protein [Rosistilla carotiformis]QDV68965.1 Quercetin 2,3-dioxygenase [Rosistilla carotiformis]
MIKLRKSEERGHADFGRLNSYHTFSFASYHDQNHMGFRALRVMNEDRVAAGQGFGHHSHANMEIVSYVLDGTLELKDWMETGEVVQTGELQRISAGTGISHSEFNPSGHQSAHFYQFWLLPKHRDVRPSSERRRFADNELKNSLRLVASPDGRDGSMSIQQDAMLYLSKLDHGASLDFAIADSRYVWLQVLRGAVSLNAAQLEAGAGAAIEDESMLKINATSDAEIMLFDLA